VTDVTELQIDVGETNIFVACRGAGPPILLLHGFPQTHIMWRGVATRLASRFRVICADLRGYGRSGCPPSTPDHAPYSKRAMARDLVVVMERLGHPTFAIAGHDRGGRVAYRMALDHPERVERLAVLDIVPGSTAWDRADDHFALGYWPWSFLAQPYPLPEAALIRAADVIVDNALGGWGSPPDVFSTEVRQSYIDAIRNEAHAHAICEEYRAGAGIDRQHDAADRSAGNTIACPTLVLWSGTGSLENWYSDEGGPLALWRLWSRDVEGTAVRGGHFFPEENPETTAGLLDRFFGR
jgi:haloacetate dehalogenase